MRWRWWITVVLVALPAGATVTGAVDSALTCDESGVCQGLEARTELDGGVAADLVIEFEDASDLELFGLGISAQLVDPSAPELQQRLPSGTFIPSDFPVLPSLWRSTDATVYVAGEILALVGSLRFSLDVRKAQLASDSADVNRDGLVDVRDLFVLIDRVFGR